eukprot:scaffold222964_cov40-Prasinocladus_malaysianus.AAC.1
MPRLQAITWLLSSTSALSRACPNSGTKFKYPSVLEGLVQPSSNLDGVTLIEQAGVAYLAAAVNQKHAFAWPCAPADPASAQGRTQLRRGKE